TIAAKSKCAASAPHPLAGARCLPSGSKARSARIACSRAPPAPSRPKTMPAASSCRNARIHSSSLVSSASSADTAAAFAVERESLIRVSLDDAHDGTLAQADTWLRVNIAPLLSSSDFNTPGGGLLIIVFDESESSDGEFGGGHVAWVAVGPNVNPGYPPAGFAKLRSVELGGDELSVPGQQRIRSRDSRQFFQGFPSEPVGDLRQPSSFGIG